MSAFRKKPVVIEAIQWCGNCKHIAQWLQSLGLDKKTDISAITIKDEKWLFIFTPEGLVQANLNTWIIQGVKGELYPCEPDIFAASYEPVP